MKGREALSIVTVGLWAESLLLLIPDGPAVTGRIIISYGRASRAHVIG